jgi:uncharacterized protein (TIGR00266 family)
MNIDISCRPAAAAAELTLAAGETVTVEVGAMIAMDTEIRVETTSQSRGQFRRKGLRGMLQGLRRLFSGESFFLNHFTATAEGQKLILGSTLVGDIISHRLDGSTLVVQSSSWMASTPGVDIDTTWAGLSNAFFSGEGVFWVKCSGTGDVLVNSFGAIYPVDVDGEYIVDTGHIVAYEDTLSFKPRKATDSWIGSFLGGEGLVCAFSGRGRVYCQTHNPPSFGQALAAKLKPRSN